MADHNQALPESKLNQSRTGMAGDQKVIDLSGLDVVAQGNRRFVYLIQPGTPGFEEFDIPLVMKVPRYEDRERRMGLAKRLLSKLFPISAERGIRVEARYWTKLARRVPEKPSSMPLPVFYGYVMTTDGRAALWEAMCDADGDLAPTLREIANQGDPSILVEPLNRFVDFSYRHNLVAPDIQGVNMVLVERNGRWETVLIDGYADMRLISFRSMFAWRNRQNMDNRFGKMGRQLKLDYDVQKREYSRPQTAS